MLQLCCLLNSLLLAGGHDMSSKKVTAKEIFSRNVRPIRVDLPKEKKEKSAVVKGKKKEEEEVIDDRLEIATSSLNTISQEYLEKLQARKRQKQKELKQKVENSQPKDGQLPTQTPTLVNQQSFDLKQSPLKRQKQPQKSRSKIFKQSLINEIPLETKTSLHRWSYGEGTTSSKLIIGCWNVNGIRSVMNKKMLYPYIHANKPDIICITETKADEKNFDSSPITINGYQSYWNFSKVSSGYSGVAIFSKFLPKSATEDMLQRQHSQEGRILTLQFQRFMLINIYVPTVGKDLQRIQYRKRYDTAFREHVNRVRMVNPSKPVIIAGDLNVAHTELDIHPGKNIMLSPSFTATERQGLTELLNMGYVDVFRALNPEKRAYTWWYVNIGGRDRLDTPGLGRRIDYFLMPKECMQWVKRCEILRQFYGADHCPVEMQLDLEL